MAEHEIATGKRPLSHAELTDIIDLCLWAGQMLLQHGANSLRVEESVHRLGTGLGCDWLDIVVRTESLTITATSGGEFRTKTRRVVRLGINMARITALNDLSRRVAEGELDRFQTRAVLAQLDRQPGEYNRWLVVVMVGLACAAFSRLFGGDWPVFGVTFVAAAVAMLTRQELIRRQLNPFLMVTACAFVAGLIASSAAWLHLSQQPQIAMSASVLLLAPGVPLINAAHDLIRGYMSNGVARGVTGLLISLAIAVGLLLAILLTGTGI
ncbi:MAG TPA: threonine/serine exporter family protein [Chloroflexota bacterium]|nr:threonine/serine exporter family protein [Chloroflexota bacterium]